MWLLAADRSTVLAQHHVAPRTSAKGPRGRWIQVRFLSQVLGPRGWRGGVGDRDGDRDVCAFQVSHVFRHYGSGVRFVHFMHKTKNRMAPGGLLRTRVTDSSVSVQLRE